MHQVSRCNQFQRMQSMIQMRRRRKANRRVTKELAFVPQRNELQMRPNFLIVRMREKAVAAINLLTDQKLNVQRFLHQRPMVMRIEVMLNIL